MSEPKFSAETGQENLSDEPLLVATLSGMVGRPDLDAGLPSRSLDAVNLATGETLADIERTFAIQLGYTELPEGKAN